MPCLVYLTFLSSWGLEFADSSHELIFSRPFIFCVDFVAMAELSSERIKNVSSFLSGWVLQFLQLIKLFSSYFVSSVFVFILIIWSLSRISTVSNSNAMMIKRRLGGWPYLTPSLVLDFVAFSSLTTVIVNKHAHRIFPSFVVLGIMIIASDSSNTVSQSIWLQHF